MSGPCCCWCVVVVVLCFFLFYFSFFFSCFGFRLPINRCSQMFRLRFFFFLPRSLFIWFFKDQTYWLYNIFLLEWSCSRSSLFTSRSLLWWYATDRPPKYAIPYLALKRNFFSFPPFLSLAAISSSCYLARAISLESLESLSFSFWMSWWKRESFCLVLPAWWKKFSLQTVTKKSQTVIWVAIFSTIVKRLSKSRKALSLPLDNDSSFDLLSAFRSWTRERVEPQKGLSL